MVGAGTPHFGQTLAFVEIFFPHLVSELTEDDGSVIKSVNYIDMIPLLLSKIQKMQKEIDELKENR